MRLRFILPELEAFTRLNPARGSADIDNDELSSPGSEQAADVIFGERSDPCRGLESIISPQFAGCVTVLSVPSILQQRT